MRENAKDVHNRRRRCRRRRIGSSIMMGLIWRTGQEKRSISISLAPSATLLIKHHLLATYPFVIVFKHGGVLCASLSHKNMVIIVFLAMGIYHSGFLIYYNLFLFCFVVRVYIGSFLLLYFFCAQQLFGRRHTKLPVIINSFGAVFRALYSTSICITTIQPGNYIV